MSNYAHIWFISERLRYAHQLPFHMPVLAHGRALAYPYGFVPWTIAAFMRLLLGDWAVTLTIVASFWLMVTAMFAAFPELRKDPTLGIATLGNPAVVIALIVGQLPFMVAAAFLFTAIRSWRRRSHPVWVVTWCGLAQLTHPAVVLPIAMMIVAGRLFVRNRRRELLQIYVVSCAIALPAVLLVVASPVFTDSSRSVKLLQFTMTIAERAPVFLLPIVLVARPLRMTTRSAVAVACLLLNFAVGPLDTGLPWRVILGLPTHSATLTPFLDSTDFVEGDVYRVLGGNDGKRAMYDVLRHGGTLDSEFFPESINLRIRDAANYRDVVIRRHIDFVAVSIDYDRRYYGAEHHILDSLADDPAAACSHLGISARRISTGPYWFVYRLDRECK